MCIRDRDFNGDGKVDGQEILILAASWDQVDPLLDIGPYVWGDGIVNIQDVSALADYLGKDVYDPTLIAHWPLDETEGATTREVITGTDSQVMGEPIWEPDGGVVDGALRLDGVDDDVVTNFKLYPSTGPLSVLVWIKGGTPGQAIISESFGPDWLSLNTQTGCLMTEIAGVGRSSGPLLSQTTINDGNWHRIAFVWDGLLRKLYVDGAVVAEDIQNGLQSPGNGLYIGCGDPLQPSTFFSGLIDDVRIYNRAVNP